jgi:predicted acyltransferase
MATVETVAVPAITQPRLTPGERAYSIDAFRGFTMVFMLSEGFGLLYYRNSPVLGPIANQLDHMQWSGYMHFWDMIQPFFMFIVGLVMPISFGKRWASGETWGQSLGHVLRRCALLLLFGVIARSVQANRPNLDLINVLAQLSFTYLVAFLVLRKSWRVQAAVAGIFLVGHWALYQFVTAPGVLGPWVRDANIGWWLDKTVLNNNWGGSYATINCISSAANTIFGVMCGELLASAAPLRRKFQILISLGIAGVLAGIALHPVIPINKKIWTASFALYSGGFTLLALALFYWICDVKRKRAWARLFVIVGANSIAIYLFHEILHRWLTRTMLVFTGWSVTLWGNGGRTLNMLAVLAFEIYVCVWLYRRKIFLKI